MKKYPLLSMALIFLVFALLAISLFWLRTAKKEEKKEIVPEISAQEKKAQFKSTIIPAVNEVYTDLMQQYQEVAALVQADHNNERLTALKKEYKATNNEELLMALKPHPESITIAQAAIESSWATSRFFREANNVFGIWSFDKNEARIAAGEMRGDQTIWVKKYRSVKASIRDYYRTLARGDAYTEFRILKMETSDPYELVKKLDNYSEKGEEYGKELSAIIRFNNFAAYDQQQKVAL
ncbi:MAG: glucosaminidase domain-containing protein [Desulfuromusa sp.]|nr:glucosaminidase domain-containing protein [Desulfuromusa sp.]